MTQPAAPFREAFDRTRALSQFVARVAGASPAIVDEIEARGARAYGREEMRGALGPGEDLGLRLRQLRARVMVTLAHRDLNGLASLDEVFETMTALAEECIAAAAAEAQRRAAERYGEPQAGAALAVVALGKLGGGELNVSSDVDLVFLYGAGGETAGRHAVSHHEFFAAVARTLIALLAEPAAEGPQAHVDSGPLVTSL